MAISIKYGDSLLTSMGAGQSKTLKTEGKLMEKDIQVIADAAEGGIVTQADWEATSGASQILNKPTFGDHAFQEKIEKGDLSEELRGLLSYLYDKTTQLKEVFVGSRSQYNTARTNGEVPIGTIVVITDFDVDQKTSAVLGQAILGWLILGQN